MYVTKKGRIENIPVKAGTVVRLRENRSGNLTHMRAVVLGATPSSPFSRAYGKQVYVCQFFKRSGAHPGGGVVSTRGAGDVYPVGRVKRIPKECKEALADFERSYPTLARKKRKK